MSLDLTSNDNVGKISCVQPLVKFRQFLTGSQTQHLRIEIHHLNRGDEILHVGVDPPPKRAFVTTIDHIVLYFLINIAVATQERAQCEN